MIAQDTEATGERSSNGLPWGWAWTTLGEACNVVMGQSPPSDTYNTVGEGLPFFQGKAEFGELYPTAIKWCSKPNKIAHPGDILISIRAPVGPTNLCKETACIGRGLAAVRPTAGMPSRYFLYLLRLLKVNLADKATGTTFEAISGKVLRSQRIPLAPSIEQGRIVTAIEQQFSRIDAGITALKQVQAKLRRYRAAVLKAAVEGTLTEEWRAEHPGVEPASDLLGRILDERRKAWEQAELARFAKSGKTPPKGWQTKYREPEAPDTTNLPALPEGWCWTRFDQLITHLRNGLPQKPDTSPPGYPILRINAVRPMHVDLEEVRFLDLPSGEVSDYFIEDGNILFTRYNGSLELLGVAGLVRGCARPTLHPDKLIRARTVLPNVLPAFLELASNVGASRIYIERKARTTAGQTGISGGDLKQMPMPLPPLAEQEQIVAEVERRLSVVEETEAQVAAELTRAERLRQGILALAFAGKLVPQDPADEPASALLERIRAEKGPAKGD